MTALPPLSLGLARGPSSLDHGHFCRSIARPFDKASGPNLLESPERRLLNRDLHNLPVATPSKRRVKATPLQPAAPDADASPSPSRQYKMQTHGTARAAEAELLAEHADSRAAELEAKRRLVRLRSELNRSRTDAALRGVNERRRAAARSVRTSQDERSGLKVCARA